MNATQTRHALLRIRDAVEVVLGHQEKIDERASKMREGIDVVADAKNVRNLRVARHHVRAAWGAVAAPSAARKAAMVRAWASRASNKAVARYAEAVAAAGTEAPKGLAVATDAAYSAIRMREQVNEKRVGIPAEVTAKQFGDLFALF